MADSTGIGFEEEEIIYPIPGGFMKAELIKDNLKGFNGHAALYKLSPPMKDVDCDDIETEHEYVVVSAVYTLGAPETYIFSANAEGMVTAWGALKGSYKGGMSHVEALEGAGYSL